jgi:hypothetical protein
MALAAHTEEASDKGVRALAPQTTEVSDEGILKLR